MRIMLDEQAQAWRDRAARFASEELIPHEVEAELNEGKLPAEVKARHKRLAIELGFSAMDVPAAHGGSEARVVDQVAVWEQLGRVTNALCWCFSEPHRWMFEACSPEQLERYVLPLMSGKRKECYAITESGSGSDVEDPDDRARAAPRATGSPARSGTSRARTTPTISSCRRGSPTARMRARTRCSSSTRASRVSRSCARRSSATPSAIIIRPTASTTSSCRRASASAPKATACSTRTAGSAANG